MQLRSQFHNNSLDTFLEVQITSFIHSRRISKLYHTFAIVQTFQLNVLKSTILSNTGSTLSNHVRFLRSLNKSLFPLTPVHHMRPLLPYFFLYIYIFIYYLCLYIYLYIYIFIYYLLLPPKRPKIPKDDS